jgi:chitinase
LIKKAGGIEELEKQIYAQEDNFNAKNDKQATTPSAIIKQSLVEKIKNRSSLFKPRAPIFNGASQPDKVVTEKKSSSIAPEQSTISLSVTPTTQSPKKYNSISRFSRPQSQTQTQNADNDAPSNDSEVKVIEKPQYSSIARRKPVKPEVVAENDYNNDPEKLTSVEETSKASEVSKKYATISRTRRPQQTIVEESVESEDSDEDDEDAEEEAPVRVSTTTSTKAPSKYINLSRRRSTAAPIER